MRAPKLMPWWAHRSGLSRGRTESLWRDACRYAQNATGEHETPRYWKVATERMASLLEVERLAHLRGLQSNETVDRTESRDLPRTGNDPRGLVALGLALLATGAATLTLRRRRTTN